VAAEQPVLNQQTAPQNVSAQGVVPEPLQVSAAEPINSPAATADYAPVDSQPVMQNHESATAPMHGQIEEQEVPRPEVVSDGFAPQVAAERPLGMMSASDLPNVDYVEKVPVEEAQQESIQRSPEEIQTAIAVTLAGNNEWGELVEQTDLAGLPKELAMNCACEKLAKDKIVLSLAEKSKHLFKESRVDDIQSAIQLVTKTGVIVEMDFDESDKETPAECLERLGFEQFEQTKENLQNDPNVKAIVSEFGAQINEQSIQTIEPTKEQEG